MIKSVSITMNTAVMLMEEIQILQKRLPKSDEKYISLGKRNAYLEARESWATPHCMAGKVFQLCR